MTDQSDLQATPMDSAQETRSSEITISSQESEPQPDDVWIVVLGMTGVGKSTLISEFVGHDVGVGHGLQSSK
jgi:putative ribosome biogenesis GTPase RsgA